MTVDLDRRYRFKKPLFEAVAQRFDTTVFFLQRRRSEFGCFPESNNRSGIFGSAASFVLLAAADQVGIESGFTIDVQRGDTLSAHAVYGRKVKES